MGKLEPGVGKGLPSLADNEVQKCPYQAYRQLRDHGPIYLEPETGFYVILDHGLCRKIAADSNVFRNDTGILRGRRRPEVIEIYERGGVVPIEGLVTADGDEHRFQRALVEKVFTVGHVKKMEPYLVELIDDCIDQFIGKRAVDFHDEFAVKVPLTVIADQLGVPREDLPLFRYWTQCSEESSTPLLDPARELELMEVEVEFYQYLLKKAEHYRKHPSNVLMSHLVHADIDGRRVTDGELVAMAAVLIIAGNETTTNALSNAMNRLVEQPEFQDILREHPEKIDAFVEEVLRYEAPIQGLFRLVTKDTEIAGTPIPEGSILVLRWGAANRDPGAFKNPDVFDLERKDTRKHVTFGYGPHFCLGFHLARAEMRISIERMLARTRNIRFADADGFEKSGNYVVSGYSEQRIAFDLTS